MATAPQNKQLLLGQTALSALSMLIAGAHRMQLNDLTAYTSSWLIPLEFFMMIVLLLCCVVLPFYILLIVLRRQWDRFGIALLTLCIAVAGLFFTLVIDSPTLVYAT